ncbi:MULTISPECIES: RagB/SusD family nutrient uptake outer membrane protein [unclassified Sphingobacterium]|uniref:RagB/SusD family nutrient uptake outer membrane protein n=1 Tax=unclassified Sphingobacterium TaxID=2609468 RepID=UPI0025E98174|nr:MULTISPECIES: RagB/SusD family nutrient uptake outer membrane protein [unclassified Sphingobacterium]
MNRKRIYNLLLSLILIFSGTACTKWLDVKPKTEVSETVLFENEQGFKDAMTGVYTQLGSVDLYGKEFTMGLMDVLAQNYNVSINTHVYYQARNYNYLDIGTRSKIDNFWISSYKAIANLNNLLRQIDQKKNVFAGINYEIIKGEALALRAFLHFDLLRAFGPVPLNNMDAESIPYSREFNMNVKPVLSLKQFTQECLDDLSEASKLLASDKNVYYGNSEMYKANTRNHMNYWAATGLMARIYLYRNEHTIAYQKAKEVIDAKIFPFISSSSISSNSSPDRIFSTEHLFAVYVADLRDINDELFRSFVNFNNVLTNTSGFTNNRYELSSGGSTDYRFLFLWKSDGVTAARYPVKYRFDDIGSNAGSTTIKRIPLIRLSEMYYICAETSTVSTDKIDFLNEVRLNRGLATLAKNLTDQAIENEIFKEYKKEFYQEGQLFYYYKRKNRLKIEGYGPDVSSKVYVLPVPDNETEYTTE